MPTTMKLAPKISLLFGLRPVHPPVCPLDHDALPQMQQPQMAASAAARPLAITSCSPSHAGLRRLYRVPDEMLARPRTQLDPLNQLVSDIHAEELPIPSWISGLDVELAHTRPSAPRRFEGTDTDDPTASGVSAFLIERGTPGLTTSEPTPKMGQEGAPIGEVHLQDCRVPADVIIGGMPGRGFRTVMKTLLSCRRFAANAVRLQFHAMAYNLANFLRTLALPEEVAQWTMTTLRNRLVKIGARIVRHGRSITFQMAEVMVPRGLFQIILGAIATLRPLPPIRC